MSGAMITFDHHLDSSSCRECLIWLKRLTGLPSVQILPCGLLLLLWVTVVFGCGLLVKVGLLWLLHYLLLSLLGMGYCSFAMRITVAMEGLLWSCGVGYW